jgi:hypothetical protein
MVKKVEREPTRPDEVGGLDELGDAGVMVASGATLMKIENENMQAMSLAHPRNERKVLSGALEELEQYPDLAARYYYSIPYAEERGSDRKVEVKGPSVHAALSLARRWGNCVVRGFQVGEDEDKVYLSGVFLDMETNFRVERPHAVSKFIRRRDGKTQALREQRLIMAIQAGASKAMRNAILNGLPDGLVEAFYGRARSVAAREAKERWSKMLTAFREFGVSREMIEDHLGHPLEKVTENEVADLIGIYNALNDGQVQATDIFGKRTKPDPEATSTVDDVMAQGADVTGGAEKAPEPTADAESPSERPASTPKSTDPEPTIGAEGAALLEQTAKARAAEIGCTAELLCGLAVEHYGVALLVEIPKAKLAQAIKLIAGAEMEPDEPQAAAAKPTAPEPIPVPVPTDEDTRPVSNADVKGPSGTKEVGF